MPTRYSLTLASLSAVGSETVTIQQEEKPGRQSGLGAQGMWWDWEKKLICLECFLSFLIWLTFSFKSQWLDGIKHTKMLYPVFCCFILCHSEMEQISDPNLTRKLCFVPWTCLSLILNWKMLTLLPIRKQINITEKPFPLHHLGLQEEKMKTTLTT